MFNGLKTTIRAFSTRGTKLSFDEVVALLNSEDVQLLQDSSTDIDKSTVLVTTHSNQPTSHSNVSGDNSGSMVSFAPTQSSSMNHRPYGYRRQPMPFFNNFNPQVRQFPWSFKSFPRGRWGGGPGFPIDPYAICGRSNHITSYCYYKTQYPSFQ